MHTRDEILAAERAAEQAAEAERRERRHARWVWENEQEPPTLTLVGPWVCRYTGDWLNLARADRIGASGTGRDHFALMPDYQLYAVQGASGMVPIEFCIGSHADALVQQLVEAAGLVPPEGSS